MANNNQRNQVPPRGPALRKRFALRLKELRATRGLTQDELAERSGVSVDSVRRIERAVMSPTLDALGKLCGGLDISLPALFAGMGLRRGAVLGELCDQLATLGNADLRRAVRVLRALCEVNCPGHG